MVAETLIAFKLQSAILYFEMNSALCKTRFTDERRHNKTNPRTQKKQTHETTAWQKWQQHLRLQILLA